MTAKAIYHSRRGKPKKRMLDITTILAGLNNFLGLFSAAARLFCRKRPVLKLVHDLRFNDQGPCSGSIFVFIENEGKAPAKDILVALKIIKPRGIHPGYGLLFEDDIGSPESWKKPDFLDTSHRPQTGCFRLKPDVFINPGEQARVKICRFIFSAVEQTAPSEIDHEIEWTVQCAGIAPTSGTIVVNGGYLKRILLTDLYESGCVIGYKIPTGKIPESSEKDQEE